MVVIVGEIRSAISYSVVLSTIYKICVSELLINFSFTLVLALTVGLRLPS
jgi:hypothetical protein